MLKISKSLDKFQYPWYREEYPEIDSIVIGRVKSITDMGLFFELLDYQFRDAFMPLNQVSKKKFKSVRSIFKIGDIKPVLVLRIDDQKGYIDLSNKYIEMATEDISRIERYASIITVFLDWLKHVVNKDKKTDDPFIVNIDSKLWTKIMEITVWKYPKSEIYQLMKDISTNQSTVQIAFPELYKAIDGLIEHDDLIMLDQCIKSAFKIEVSLHLKIKLIVLSIHSISVIQNICHEIRNKFESDGYSVFLDITCPFYEFIIKDSNKDRLESYGESLDTSLSIILDKYLDIEYIIDKNMVV
jgi:translation initiation factor 2 alpha subunit (eIF-2alpha)